MSTLPTFQGNVHVKIPLWSYKLPSHFLLSAYRPGQAVACASVSWYCLMVIDRYTHWSEALPVSEVTAKAVAKVFVTIWVACFSCLQQITPEKWRPPSPDPVTRTTVWYPTSSGMIKKLHHQLKAALLCHANKCWAQALSLVLLQICSTQKTCRRHEQN